MNPNKTSGAQYKVCEVLDYFDNLYEKRGRILKNIRETNRESISKEHIAESLGISDLRRSFAECEKTLRNVTKKMKSKKNGKCQHKSHIKIHRSKFAVKMSERSSISKVADTFDALYKERRRTLEDVLQKFKEAREKMNKEYSNRKHGPTKHANLKAVKIKKKVTIDTRGQDAISLDEQPIVSDYKVDESDDFRYKVHNLVTYTESTMLKKFKKYK